MTDGDVVVVVPSLRWDERTDAAVASALRQEGVASLRVIVALAEHGSAPNVLPSAVAVVANPRRTIGAGLNEALTSSSSEFVVRLDNRCELQSGYVRLAISQLRSDQVGCVGGRQVVADQDLLGYAYAQAFNGGLLGGGRYRYSLRDGRTDTAYLGAWRREVLDAAGWFDELMVRNQDAEMAERVRNLGLDVLHVAELAVRYFSDRSLGQLMRHHYEFGWWRAARLRRGDRALHARQLLVPVAGLGALSALRLLRTARPLVASSTLTAAYVALSVGAALVANRLRRGLPVTPDHGVTSTLLAPALAILLNISTYVGFFLGLVGARRRLLERRSYRLLN